MQDIMLLTFEMESKYPELYKYLNETPMDLSETNDQKISTNDLKLYLETLKTQLQHHIETHKSTKGRVL